MSFLTNRNNNEVIDGFYYASDLLNRVGNDARVVVFWYKYGGIRTNKYPTNIFHYKRLCQVVEVSNITGEPTDDRETFEVGKRTKRVNDGVVFSMELTLKGNDAYNMLTFEGRNAHNQSSSTANFDIAYNIGENLGNQGCLVMLAQDSSHRVIKSTVIPDCEISLFDSAGVSASETNYVVQVNSKTAPVEFGLGQVPVPFIMYDDGVGTTITNAAAPDGALTDFAVKDANGAFPSASIPAYDLVSQVARHGASNDFDKYVIEARLGPVGQVNSRLNSTSASYAPATSTLTLNTAPTDGYCLEGIVIMSAANFPTWSDKKKWHVDEIVEYNGTYYICAPTTGTDTLDIPTGATANDWDSLSTQKFPAPYYPSALQWDGIKEHRDTAQPTCCVLSWTDWQVG